MNRPQYRQYAMNFGLGAECAKQSLPTSPELLQSVGVLLRYRDDHRLRIQGHGIHGSIGQDQDHPEMNHERLARLGIYQTHRLYILHRTDTGILS